MPVFLIFSDPEVMRYNRPAEIRSRPQPLPASADASAKPPDTKATLWAILQTPSDQMDQLLQPDVSQRRGRREIRQTTG